MFVNENDIRRRIEAIEGKLNKFEMAMKKMPEGELICAKNGEYYKWYKNHDNTYEYIPKSNRLYAQKLAMKKYYDMSMKDLQTELAACNAYITKAVENKNYAEIFLQHSEYGKLVEKEIVTKSRRISEWYNAEFEKNMNYPEKLTVKGTNGKYLRSKSEAIIDRILYNAGVPFHYEEKLALGHISFYPDFTIMHPETEKIYYWEHFGMMDNQDYIGNACSKLRTYCENGIIPSVNLILTFETKEHPLTIDEIEDIVAKFFL